MAALVHENQRWRGAQCGLAVSSDGPDKVPASIALVFDLEAWAATDLELGLFRLRQGLIETHHKVEGDPRLVPRPRSD